MLIQIIATVKSFATCIARQGLLLMISFNVLIKIFFTVEHAATKVASVEVWICMCVLNMLIEVWSAVKAETTFLTGKVLCSGCLVISMARVNVDVAWLMMIH